MPESTAPAAPAPPTLRESAALVGAGVWFERRCFEVVGGLVATTPEPAARSVLSAISRHHAWRAEQLESVLARTHDLGPADVVGPTDGFDDDVLADLAGAEGAAARLERLDAVLEAWTERLRAHRATLVPMADAPLQRVLDIVVEDLRRDRADLAAARDRAPSPR